jgi:hypothetical protein
VSEDFGYVRVVNVRAEDEDFRAAPGERVIPMDRASNSLMGNRHDMKSKSMAERDRVVAAHAADLEADIKRKGPMHQAMMAIAFDIVDRGDKVAIQCFCAPKPCHLDLVAATIASMAQEIRNEAANARQPGDSAPATKASPKV